jgi:hypothetical protein
MWRPRSGETARWVLGGCAVYTSTILVMMYGPGYARKPGIGLGFCRLRLDKTQSPAHQSGSGSVRPGQGSSPGFSYKNKYNKKLIIYFYSSSLSSSSASALSSQVRSPSWVRWDSTASSSRAVSVAVHGLGSRKIDSCRSIHLRY